MCQVRTHAAQQMQHAGCRITTIAGQVAWAPLDSPLGVFDILLG